MCWGSWATEPIQSVSQRYCVSVRPQGEQCNIVPDNVDDIVADIAQEEKEEGRDPALVSLSISLLHSFTRLKA